MTISVVFDPPLLADSPAVFNSKAFTLVGNLNTFSTQANSTASDINAQVTDPGVVAIGKDLTGANTIGNVSGISANVTTVAGISANVTTVAGISANVTTVANNTANINAAVADLPSLAAKVSKTGDTMTGNLNVPSLNGGQIAGHRNKIINGAMTETIRGTSFANANGYTLDRWLFAKASVSVAAVSVSRQAGDVAVTKFNTSLRVAVTTADASIGTGDFAFVGQRIEGTNVLPLIGTAFTISFWVRSSKTGVHCVSLRNSGSDRSFVMEYTVNAANTFEYKTLTVATGLVTAGTWDFTSGTGIELGFVLACGTEFQTTPGAWQTGNFIATANQVNVLDTIDNIFEVTGVQLEPGAIATPFEHRMIERLLCQRYARLNGIAMGVSNSATVVEGLGVDFATPMRGTPSATLLSGGVNVLHDPGVAFRDASALTTSITSVGGYLGCTSSGMTANRPIQLQPGFVLFSAEL